MLTTSTVRSVVGLHFGPSRGLLPMQFTGSPVVDHAATRWQLLPPSSRLGCDRRDADTVARAATAQYTKVLPVEHVYPLVRTQKQLDRVLAEIEESPGIVLYTLLDDELLAAAGKPLPRTEPAMPVDSRTGAAAPAILSRRRNLTSDRRAAHAQCGIFQAHRCAQLHHAA